MQGRGRLADLDSPLVPGWNADTFTINQFADDSRDQARRTMLTQRSQDQARTRAAIPSGYHKARQISGAIPDSFPLGNVIDFFNRLSLGQPLFNEQTSITFGPQRRGPSAPPPLSGGRGRPPPSGGRGRPGQRRRPPPPGRRQRVMEAWRIPSNALFMGDAFINLTGLLCNPPANTTLVAFDMPGVGNDCMFNGVAFAFNLICSHAADALGRRMCARYHSNTTGQDLRKEAAEMLYATNATGGYIIPDGLIVEVISDFNVDARERTADYRFEFANAESELSPVFDGPGNPDPGQRIGQRISTPPAPPNPAWASRGIGGDYQFTNGNWVSVDRVRVEPLPLLWNEATFPENPQEGMIIRPPRPDPPTWTVNGAMGVYEWDGTRWLPVAGGERMIPFSPIVRFRLGLEMMGNTGGNGNAYHVLSNPALDEATLRQLLRIYGRGTHVWVDRTDAIRFINELIMQNVMGADAMLKIITKYMFPGLSIAVHRMRDDHRGGTHLQCEKVVDLRDPIGGNIYRNDYNDTAYATVALYISDEHYQVLGVQYPKGATDISSLYTVRNPRSDASLLFRWLLSNTIRDDMTFCNDWSPLPPSIGTAPRGHQRRAPEEDTEELPTPEDRDQQREPPTSRQRTSADPFAMT